MHKNLDLLIDLTVILSPNDDHRNFNQPIIIIAQFIQVIQEIRT